MNAFKRYIIPVLLFTLNYSIAQNDSLIHSGYHINRGKMLADSALYELAIKEFQLIDPRDTNYVLSRAELATVLLNIEKYDQALKECMQGLQYPSPYRSRLFLTLGTTLTEMESYERADSALHKGLEEFPTMGSLLAQLGKMEYTRKHYDEAEKYLFKALEFSPFLYTPHLYLSIISMLRGEKVKGMMSMGIYMAINNSANKQLVTLEHFVKSELTDEFSVAPSKNNPFARLDRIIRSEIAMEKAFTTKIPIDAGIVKQFDLFFEQIQLNQYTGNDPWVSFYLRIYLSMIKANVQEAFIYHILGSSSIEKVKEWKSKNEKALNRFYPVINEAISHDRGKQLLDSTWNYTGEISLWYASDQHLEAIGDQDAKGAKTGLWYYLDKNGTILSKGNYSNGKKSGLWSYYNNSGIRTSSENFDTHEEMYFNEDGKIQQHYFLENGKVEGEVKLYNDCGNLSEKLIYKNGLREGAGTVYSPNGIAINKYTFEKNLLNGMYLRYYNTGERLSSVQYDGGERDGVYTEWYRNGKVYSTGTYIKGKAQGKWTIYHDNGKLQESGQYEDDNPSGEFSYYDYYGVLTEKRNYNSIGQYQGEDTFYKDGFLFSKLLYDSGRVVSYTNYDRKGKEFSTFSDPGGTFSGKFYYVTGELRSEFNYLNGKASGTWKFYYRNGDIEFIANYKDDLLNGDYKTFHVNGKTEVTCFYENGELDGEYTVYFLNGNVKVKGWYQNGLKQQRWLTFYSNGSIETDEYFLNDEKTGYTDLFDSDGRLSTRTWYNKAGIKNFHQFSKDLKLISARVDNGTQSTYISKYPTTDTLFFLNVNCGQLDGKRASYLPGNQPYSIHSFNLNTTDGKYQSYEVGGKPNCSGQYDMGDPAGKWSWLYPNGNEDVVGYYINGKRDSLWTYYYDSGKPSGIYYYRQGEKHGESRIYGPDGQLIFEKQYDRGDMIAYRDPFARKKEWISFSGDGILQSKYANGNLAFEEKYVKGRLDGERKIFYANGTVFSQENFKCGNLEGISIERYSNGNVSVKKNFYLDDANGRWEYYSPDGKIVLVENYMDGYVNGVVEVYENGKKRSERYFRNGSPNY